MKTRLFIGNLAPTVTEEELKTKFESLLSNYKDEARLGNVEVKCKNDDNYFGFVDIHTNSGMGQSITTGQQHTTPLFIRKYIDLMNNTKWKGSLIKVQQAKENFIEKLKREQERRGGDSYQGKFNSQSKFEDKNARDNDVVETESSRNAKQVDAIIDKMKRSKRRLQNDFKGGYDDANKHENSHANYGFEIVDNFSPKKKSVNVKASKKKHKSESSDDSDSDASVKDGIPKFKGLTLSYPNGLPPVTHTNTSPKKQEIKSKNLPPPAPNPIQEKLLSIALEKPAKRIETSIQKVNKFTERTYNNAKISPAKSDIPIQNKLLSIAFDKPMPTVVPPADKPSPPKVSINFRKNKQEKSDQLRLQSLDKQKEFKLQRQNIIKTSLSSVSVIAPTTEQRKVLETEKDEVEEDDDDMQGAPQKMSLFNNDSDDSADENDNAFNVKRQFEGAAGQKLLELKSKWGNDDRFKIDSRFKEGIEEDNQDDADKEKDAQISILTDILGKTVTREKPKPIASQTSVIVPRYDPEAEINKVKDVPPPSKKAKIEKTKPDLSEAKPEPIRSTEPTTFKTADNLKSLFSSSADSSTKKNDKISDNSQQSSFSLLATFGQADPVLEKDDRQTNSSSAPRSFWQSNPFKYDSSDDEDEVSVKVGKVVKPPKSEPVFVHKKSNFFYKQNDKRFEGLEDFFLKNEDGSTPEEGAKKVDDFSEKRQELKSIIKAKIRNTKRKDEKRTLAIKRAIRRRRRKHMKINRPAKS